MKVKIKKLHKDAVIPFYAEPGDAGMDLVATEAYENDQWVTYRTGISLEIPAGYVGLLFPRSSVYKKKQRLANSVGVIDSGYRGEILLKYSKSENQYAVGDRVGQIIIMPHPVVEFVEVHDLQETSRGGGGFGSTGD